MYTCGFDAGALRGCGKGGTDEDVAGVRDTERAVTALLCEVRFSKSPSLQGAGAVADAH